MKAVIQRTAAASVSIDKTTVSQIGHGLCVLLGVCTDDLPEYADYLAQKIADLRIFEDESGKMNRSVKEISGELLVISNFTLCADGKKSGNRPSFSLAARPEKAKPLYEYFVEKLRADSGCPVYTGQFGADMQVKIENDGPVTIILDSNDKFCR